MTKPDQRDARHPENANLKAPPSEGRAPRPATEPNGAAWSVKTSKTATDPGSGEANKPKG